MADTLKTKEDYERAAKDNWSFAHRADRGGEKQMASDARGRAIEYEKCRDSWLYRTFGW